MQEQLSATVKQLPLLMRNYFDLFGIPVALKVDVQSLKKKFYELSRSYHPDFFSNAGEEAQLESLENASLLNKAYKTFQQEDATIRYVLELKGLMPTDEKYTLNNAFLMEVMDINEALMELEGENDPAARQKLLQQVQQLELEQYEAVQSIIDHYQEGTTTDADLLKVKEYYYRKKYLQRILDSISGERNIATPM